MKSELVGAILEAIENNISKDYDVVKDNRFDDVIIIYKIAIRCGHSSSFAIRIKLYDDSLICSTTLASLSIDYNDLKINDIVNFVYKLDEFYELI